MVIDQKFYADVITKYAGLLATMKIIAGLHINAADDGAAADTARAMQRMAQETVKNGT